MKTPRLGMCVSVACLCVLVIFIYIAYLGPWLSLKSLEFQVKRNLDPMELQQWATNLMAEHPSPYTRFDDYWGKNFYDSTNFPSGFKQMGFFKHGMHVLSGGQVPSVTIFGGRKGGPFLEVGLPSLAPRTNQTVIVWKPGIFFVGPW